MNKCICSGKEVAYSLTNPTVHGQAVRFRVSGALVKYNPQFHMIVALELCREFISPYLTRIAE